MEGIATSMDVMAAIGQRREITKFKSDPIPPEALDTLVRSLYLAPSGNNLPSREFIVVQDKKMLRELTSTTPYMPWLEHAAVGIVIIANPGESKYWLQDASIASGFVWLAAVSLGLGGAWGAVYHAEDAEESKRREDHVRRLLRVPESYRVLAILGFGYPDEVPPAKSKYSLERVLHREAFS